MKVLHFNPDPALCSAPLPPLLLFLILSASLGTPRRLLFGAGVGRVGAYTGRGRDAAGEGILGSAMVSCLRRGRLVCFGR